MMITGEYKVKYQKNGNVHEYVYYHCSRKSKTIKCKNLVFAKKCWTNKFPLCFKKFLWRRIGRRNYFPCLKKTKKNPPNSALLLFKKCKRKFAPYKPSSSDFLMDIWSKTLNATPTA